MELLEQALTHSSSGAANYERLEFLGDGVLGCVIAQELYARFPDAGEGRLTRLRATFIRAEALAEVAQDIGLAGAIRLGATEARDGAPKPSILADALEAVFGAIFLDGGYEAARAAVRAAFGERLDRLDAMPPKDAKTALQELAQADARRLPEYRVVSTQGEAHRRTFEVECVLPHLDLRATGSGSSRQRAEQAAARALLDKLGSA